MNPDLEKLMELQQADREIQRLNEEVAALPRKVAAIEAKLAATKGAVEKAKAAIKADETARRKYETQIQDLRQKISKYRDQSLDVKTNEQYKALLHEIEFAERDIRQIEDKILEGMLDADMNEKELRSAEAELREETAEIEKEKTETRRRTEQDQKELAEWNGKRDKLRSGISPDTLRHYDRVLKLRKTALAEARDHKCATCQVMIRPQTYDDLRKNETIIICDSCQRILYYVPPAEPAAEQPRSDTNHTAEAPAV
jgi:predicted  nucleic acid-binding Zn-ribbon protein